MVSIGKLPQPTEAFAWLQASGGPALVCRPLGEVAAHVFTTRHWPLGTQPASHEVRARGADEGWIDVAAALGCSTDTLIRVAQVHDNRVLVARQPLDTAADADIIVSSNPELGLAVRAADCVPLLVADRRSGAVAAAHSGWRGIAAGVAEAAVNRMAREFGSVPGDLIAAAGPSIGPCCYEVGDDVRETFADRFDATMIDRWFKPADRPGHWFFDQWQATRDQLVAAGVDSGRIFIAGLCTAHHTAVFCSYRRDGPPAGRLVGAIRVPPRRP